MTDTTLSAAFHKAGIKSPSDRLREIALKKMVEHAGNTFAARDAIWAEVQKDRTLLVTLFELGWRREVSALMHRVRNEISYAQTMGALQRPIEKRGAAVVAAIRAEEEREEAERRAEERAWQAEKDREHQEYLARWRATRIGSLTISEKPVWQCTPGTVRAWLDTEKRRWRTVELLIEGLPDDGRPIEFYRRPEEVEAAWANADV
jgi:hypothetical protein